MAGFKWSKTDAEEYKKKFGSYPIGYEVKQYAPKSPPSKTAEQRAYEAQLYGSLGRIARQEGTAADTVVAETAEKLPEKKKKIDPIEAFRAAQVEEIYKRHDPKIYLKSILEEGIIDTAEYKKEMENLKYIEGATPEPRVLELEELERLYPAAKARPMKKHQEEIKTHFKNKYLAGPQ